jgi:hypothetical protein
MFRRSSEKYEASRHIGETVKIFCPQLAQLLTNLEGKLVDHETIEIEQWQKDWFYIVVKDKRYLGHEGLVQEVCGWTVNLREDRIMWNNSTMSRTDNPTGGNCFVRSVKWKKFMTGTMKAKSEQFYSYSPQPVPKINNEQK